MPQLHTHRLRAWVSHLAVASLLLAQAIGLLHGVMHRSVNSPGAVAFSEARLEAKATGPFAGHAPDTLDCRLFDHLTHADLAPLPMVDLACDASAATPVRQEPCGRSPAFERSYCARGPPALA